MRRHGLKIAGLTAVLLVPAMAIAYNPKGVNYDGPLHESLALSKDATTVTWSVQDNNKDGNISSAEMGLYLSNDKAADTMSSKVETPSTIWQGSGYTMTIPTNDSIASQRPNKYELSGASRGDIGS